MTSRKVRVSTYSSTIHRTRQCCDAGQLSCTRATRQGTVSARLMHWTDFIVDSELYDIGCFDDAFKELRCQHEVVYTGIEGFSEGHFALTLVTVIGFHRSFI